MALQLKGENNSSDHVKDKQLNPWDVPKKEQNPWDVSKDESMDLKFEEPKVVYNTAMAEVQAKQKESNSVVGVITKMIVALAVCGLVIFAGRQIVSKLMPEGIDITKQLTLDSNKLQAELGETFVDNPAWSSEVYEYSESDPSFAGAEDVGVVYMNGKQIGVHIPNKTYTIFNTKVGDGEKHMYDNTTYPFDNFISIVDTMAGKATLYIYYNTERNDCIFFLINNTTNRIESITYYNDYKEVTETLTTF